MDNVLTLSTPDSLASDVTDALTRLIDSRLRHVEARCADLESVVLTQDEQIRQLQRRLDSHNDRFAALELTECVQDDHISGIQTALHELRRYVDRVEASGAEPDDEQIRASVRDMIRDGEIVVTLDYV